MATVNLLRACRGAQRLLMRPPTVKQSFPALMRPDVTSKSITFSPALSSIFYARRGPFTQEEKRGGHMMLASTHWKIERVLAVSMIGILPAALFVQGPVMDAVFSTSIFMHGFWAMDHVLTDYAEKFVPFIHYVYYAVCIIAFAGLINFNYNDVGVTKAVSMLWSL